MLPGLGAIRGTVEGPPDLGWTEALSMLPMPDDDLQRRRTFPARPERGALHLEPIPDQPGSYSFDAEIPRRYNAAGLVPGRGLFSNGLWHPQPVRGGALPVLDWDVEITLPPGVVAALNGAVGRDVLRWSGRADRLSLAVLSRGHVTRQPSPAGELVILETGPPRRRWERRLGQLYAEAWPLPTAHQLTVVETPMYRRLARSGPDELFLSDHALRLTDGLWRLHANAVRKAMLESALPVEDPWSRALAADIVADERKTERDPRDLLGWFAWLPQIDELLYDGNLPYYSELFDESHPADPVPDDLAEVLAPSGPPAAAARKLEARVGKEGAEAVAGALLRGETLEQAASAVGVADETLDAWRRPCPDQDLRLRVREVADGYEIEVERQAPPGAPPELVVLEVDGQRLSWETPIGPATHRVPWPLRPRKVVLDPDHLAHQTSAVGDTWPARWTSILSAWIYELDLETGRMSAFADVALRRQYDTRWLLGADIETNPANLASLQVYGLYYAGPLLDRRSRPLRLGLAVGPSLLDPTYSPTNNGSVVLDTQAWAVWDTRDDLLLPARGLRLRASGGVGFAREALAWRSISAGALGLVPLGGRLVLGARGGAGIAESDLPHRQLSLGLAGLDPGVATGDRQVDGELELRWSILRNRSVPAGVAWLSDLQLSGGAEAAWLRADPDPVGALGWTGGVATVWDLLGARPTLMELWFAHPLISSPGLSDSAWPRVLLRFEQNF